MSNYENDVLQISVNQLASIIDGILGESTFESIESKTPGLIERCFRSRSQDEHEIMTYVNVYQTSREYGGPEEGGWYYDHYECIESVKLFTPYKFWMVNKCKGGNWSWATDNIHAWQRAQEIEKELEERFKEDTPGLQIMIETHEAASQTVGSPHYC